MKICVWLFCVVSSKVYLAESEERLARVLIRGKVSKICQSHGSQNTDGTQGHALV